MRTYHPNKPFIVPPCHQGQIVERSYAYDAGGGVIVERVHDHSDGSTRYYAYRDGDPDAIWEPWNGSPDLGEALGECQVAE